MMSKHRIGQRLRNLVVCCCLTTLISCSQNEICLEPQALNLRAGFYRTDTALSLKDTQLTNALIRFGNTNTYALQLKQSSKFALPLAQNNDTTTLIFQSDSSSVLPASIDTITLVYTRKPTFISTACGYRTFFTLQQLFSTRHVIDTVKINQSEVSNEANKEHLQLVIQ